MFHVALSRLDWNGVGLASRKVAELVKSFEQVNEILDGFRYKMGAFPFLLIQLHSGSTVRFHRTAFPNSFRSPKNVTLPIGDRIDMR